MFITSLVLMLINLAVLSYLIFFYLDNQKKNLIDEITKSNEVIYNALRRDIDKSTESTSSRSQLIRDEILESNKRLVDEITKSNEVIYDALRRDIDKSTESTSSRSQLMRDEILESNKRLVNALYKEPLAK